MCAKMLIVFEDLLRTNSVKFCLFRNLQNALISRIAGHEGTKFGSEGPEAAVVEVSYQVLDVVPAT